MSHAFHLLNLENRIHTRIFVPVSKIDTFYSMFDDKKNTSTISFVAQVEDGSSLMFSQHEGMMDILPLRDALFFPGTVNPIIVGRKTSLKVIREAEKNNCIIAIFSQKEPEIEYPGKDDLYPYGVAAKVIHSMKMPDGTHSVLIQALNRIRLVSMDESSIKVRPRGIVESTPEARVGKGKLEYMTTVSMIRQRTNDLAKLTAEIPSEEVRKFVNNVKDSPYFINLICNIIPMDVDIKHDLLKADSEEIRALELLRILNSFIKLARLKREIEQKTHADIDQQQKEYFLNQEIRNLQAELGHNDESSNKFEDVEKMKKKAEEKIWTEQVKATFEKELQRLQRINPQSPDYNVQLNYLQIILQLPWDYCTNDYLNLQTAEKVLNRDHYGMEKVKERILEHLAVLKLRGDQKSPIICLYGPPGVGKTSLGKSIAASLKRKYVRVSLGGLHDESEIRGHRRTYIGAMPGRIIKNIIKAGSSNPVFILDEIDKITQANVNGDPSSALLEVLDPEQNNSFHDNYLDMDYDLSRVMFIATANDIHSIPSPLRDRMELIEVGGYLTEEKIEIAKRHLVPKEKEKNGLAEYKNLKLTKPALEFLIEHYTRESGVRGLEKQINKICRKQALTLAKQESIEKTTLTPTDVETLLGKPLFNRDKYQGNDYAGVVTGLAWTSVGGEILFIETSISKGKGGRLTLTGNLGDVMKESAMLAVEYIKSHAEYLGIDIRVFENYNLHIHVPEGAVPKDGPSAGVTMATSIASALTQRKVRENLAMTGEITLRGKVLPVGGIKEKILAAKRAGITDLMLCKENHKDIEEIPEIYLKGLTFHYVETVMDVWNFALLSEKVKNPIQFTFDEEKKED